MVSKRNADIAQTLGIDQQTAGRKRATFWVVAAIVTVLVAGGAIFFLADKGGPIQYRTAEVQRGNLTITVTATGTLEPTNQVEVGSELSGIIETVEVDYNDCVKAGQVLAKLDTDRLEPKVLQSQAALESVQAKLLEAEANVLETRNELKRLKRLAGLSKKKLPSQHDLDAAEAAFKRAQAEEDSAKAIVSQAQATLDQDQTDLAKAVIRSPINGIVLERHVEPGQTFAASFQTPVLFTLAEDLSQMELHVDIDEADVGQVQAGQDATFTVDAYPDRRFSARILKVYYAPRVVQDVVTYEALLTVDNSQLLLRPGMTATAEIITKRVEDAILVPNGALRFTPPAPEAETSRRGRSMLRAILPGPPRRPAKQRKVLHAGKSEHRVWTLRDEQPVAIPVTIGSSDGRMTEVVAGDLKPGLPLLVDVVRPGG
ncbi:MAG: efflux RND transporter periplasmic adaptor subunit [Desulfobacterales bacterium]|nr:efflux RND transporter periplasmic adaptor subunit [Desulfobacterales bacterium]